MFKNKRRQENDWINCQKCLCRHHIFMEYKIFTKKNFLSNVDTYSFYFYKKNNFQVF